VLRAVLGAECWEWSFLLERARTSAKHRGLAWLGV